MFVAVDEEDTAAIRPGTKPDADTKVITEPSTVLTVKSPIDPTYTPPATNPNCGLSPLNVLNADEPVGVTDTPPENIPFSVYDC